VPTDFSTKRYKTPATAPIQYTSYAISSLNRQSTKLNEKIVPLLYEVSYKCTIIL